MFDLVLSVCFLVFKVSLIASINQEAFYVKFQNEETEMFLSINKTGHVIGMEKGEQKWELIHSNNDFYLIKHVETHKLLENNLEGSVYLMPFNNLTNQMWHLIDKKIFRNKATNHVIDANKNYIFSQFGYGSTSQNWIIHYEVVSTTHTPLTSSMLISTSTINHITSISQSLSSNSTSTLPHHSSNIHSTSYILTSLITNNNSSTNHQNHSTISKSTETTTSNNHTNITSQISNCTLVMGTKLGC